MGKSKFQHSKKTKEIISLTSKERWKDENYKDNIRQKRYLRKKTLGYINSLETRQKLRNIMKKKWLNGDISKNQKESLKKITNYGHETRFKKGHNYHGKREEVIAKTTLMKLGKKQSKKTIAKRLKYGKDHWNWLGGKSFEPYDKSFNKKFKEEIRKRDNYHCMKCNISEEQQLLEFHKKLHIHHINYDKKVSIPENCCTLCIRCNSEININRKHWIIFFRSLLNERYGYTYNIKEVVVII